MKIGQDIRPVLDTKQNDGKMGKKPSLSFGETVAKQSEKLHSEQLARLLSDIETQGKRLLQSQTVRDLQLYKNLVQRFVKEAVNFGMQLKQNKSWNEQGRSRTLKLVKEVDEQLIQVTEAIISQEKDSISLLDKIGEIKGLLVNIYT
ncbi:YaaR family protein [Fictibacillus phosphorivorans]|uniref:YaaR family protein n=1 Tax=Fictibacillus phosphorivorans TaxID=1221500 RepID=UPI00203FB0A0|nr:YaaR family protein [Fictibacillus phosphorivorans]MCM3719900.1 YaaR family protein [Fictibacillus phosphorivorans]MCM3777590.1 YaaR family protein [Fictibacillus phosphorivorans]